MSPLVQILIRSALKLAYDTLDTLEQQIKSGDTDGALLSISQMRGMVDKIKGWL